MPYQKILVPLDGSVLAERALPYARAIAARKGSEIMLFTVATSDPAMQLDRPLKGYLQQQADDLQSKGIKVSASVAHGSAADQIISFAEKHNVDLIIASTHGQSGITRWTLGEIARKMLYGTYIPVLLVKSNAPRAAHVELKRILLPLDGSAFSEAAISYAEELAVGADTEVILLQVTEPPAPVAAAPPGWTDGVPLNWSDYENKYVQKLQQQNLQYLDKVKVTLESKGIKARPQVALGTPAKKIIQAAETEDVDLIIMGTHGRSGISRWIHGSVASKLVEESLHPVLLIRPSQPKQS